MIALEEANPPGGRMSLKAMTYTLFLNLSSMVVDPK